MTASSFQREKGMILCKSRYSLNRGNTMKWEAWGQRANSSVPLAEPPYLPLAQYPQPWDL